MESSARSSICRSKGRAGRRRHWDARHRGVVSAIATLFGLLLVIVLITNFMILPLATREANNESQHVLTIEDQMAELQAVIAQEARSGGVPISHTVPFSLGSLGVPPFGSSSPSTLEVVGASAATQNAFSVTQAVPLNISWSQSFPQCNNCKALYYNISYNNSNGQTVSARGEAGFGTIINILGNHNQDLTVDLRGNANYAYVIVAGSNNTILLTDRGNGNCNNESVLLYGQNNLLDASGLAVCGTVNIVFITSTNPYNPSATSARCPANNSQLQQTNRLLYPAASTYPALQLNQTEWFETGVGVPFHQEKAFNGFYFENETLVVFGTNATGTQPGCAFTKSVTTSYSMSSSASLRVHIENRYALPADVAFEQGAVIEQQSGGIPQMIDPPILTVSPFTPLGLSGNITMMSFVSNPAAVSGNGVVGLTTQVVAVNRLSMGLGPSPFFFGGFRFAVTTAYPQAWWSYFNANPVAFPPSLVNCHSTTGSQGLVPCNQAPPSGGLVVIRSTLNVQAIQINFVVFSVSFT